MKKRIKHAVSGNNGITIFSNLLPIYGVETYYDENDKIRYRATIGYPDSTIFEAIQPAFKIRDLTFLGFFVTTILAMMSIYYSNIALFFMLAYILIKSLYADYIVLIVWIVEHKVKRGTGRNIGRFHAAEHMAINAYEKYQRVPSIREIKKESRFSKYCGSMDTFNAIFYKTISALGIYYTIYFSEKIIKDALKVELLSDLYIIVYVVLMLVALCIVIYCILVIIAAIVEKYELLKYLQILVTEEPTDREILLAQQAIENYVILEKNLKETIIFSSFDIDEEQ